MPILAVLDAQSIGFALLYFQGHTPADAAPAGHRRASLFTEN
jgi:hypothetical protein